VPTPNNAPVTRHAGCSTFAQASILHLYDPDRSQSVVSKGAGASLEAVKSAIDQLAKNPAGVRVLSEGTSSPTVRYLQQKLAAKNVTWHEYEPISWDNERDGLRMAFATGPRVRPIARLDQAQTIVTIDCDIFVEHPASMRYSRDFARSRRLAGTLPVGTMNRLWSVESVLSHTGAMADHRLALRSDLCLPFVMALDAATGGNSAAGSAFLKEAKIKKYLDVLVEELMLNKGKAVVIAGRRQPAAVHALVARINQNLEAVGKTLEYILDPDALRETSHLNSLNALAKDMAAGKVESLIILGGNPVYDAPVDFDFTTGLGRVKTSIHLADYVNETSQKTTWHIPRAHFLEAWGDTLTWDGTVTLAQPLIAPLYGGIPAELCRCSTVTAHRRSLSRRLATPGVPGRTGAERGRRTSTTASPPIAATTPTGTGGPPCRRPAGHHRSGDADSRSPSTTRRSLRRPLREQRGCRRRRTS
jgi:molybdopterin-containing oxidoreductase family iron-sulfur binding subunit